MPWRGCMIVKDIHRVVDRWAPKGIAWERDNIGLQVGDMGARVKGILVALDVTETVIAEAKRRGANLLISHHPLLFRPPKSVTVHDQVGRRIRQLIEQGIHLYSAHTNLDFTKGGTSFALADALGLHEVGFLHESFRAQQKIVTFVPEPHVDAVRKAMAAAGAGIIGNYDHCSFASPGTGSFRGGAAVRPVIGTPEKLEQVAEVKLEMVMHEWDAPRVLQALRSAHPYEEVAYDVYPLANTSGGFGMGIIGMLDRPLRVPQFLRLVKQRLHAHTVRRTDGPVGVIRRVAACGGSGAELLDTALAREADAFITADVKYHDFHRAAGEILLIDAGHYETEHLVVDAVVRKLKKEFSQLGESVPVFACRQSTNPIKYS